MSGWQILGLVLVSVNTFLLTINIAERRPVQAIVNFVGVVASVWLVLS